MLLRIFSDSLSNSATSFCSYSDPHASIPGCNRNPILLGSSDKGLATSWKFES
ncbi:hypothetical protein PVAG01_07677 [Phlyctema vagabunda]|uniref:Uncharacterized protein n=1 Tax=Phlyctema vagabunda TaxID=108571 RepID=A0ABR4PD61_9HELO